MFDRFVVGFGSQDGSKIVTLFWGWRLLGRLWRGKSVFARKNDPAAPPYCPQEPKTTPKMAPKCAEDDTESASRPGGLREALK